MDIDQTPGRAVTLVCGLLLATVCALAVTRAGAQDPTERRRADLALLLEVLLPTKAPQTGRITARDKTWEDWVRRTGELPPDFAAMPSIAALPDPLVLAARDGPVAITTPALWAQQRAWIRSQFEHWVFGRMPPAPDNLRVASSDERLEGEITIRDVALEFGPGHRAKLHVQLMIPPGPGPFPVFLTNHSRARSPWVHNAVSRGYIGCYYRATDPAYGEPDDSDAYIDIYPDYDFACLARWAWAAARAVDYLLTCREVNKEQIGIAGHSRNGKQALLAAAFDERIGAVVASSGLQGEMLPHRYTSDPFAVESIQLTTGDPDGSHWFHPRLRFFVGREHKLPVDQNMLMALVAPRGLMLYAGYSEYSSNAFGVEQAYRDVRRVYRFLGREQNLGLHLRPGGHPAGVADTENFLDFFDAVFGRGPAENSETWIHDFDFERWKTASGVRIDPRQYPIRKPGDFLRPGAGEADWAREKTAIQGRIRWTLGEQPPALPVRTLEPGPPVLGSSPPPALVRKIRENSPPARSPIELVLGRPQRDKAWEERLAAAGMGASSLPYGAGLGADVFYPVVDGKRLTGKRPVLVWLHPYAYDAGWSAKEPWRSNVRNFILDQRPAFDALVRQGFVVVAFDQIGFGSRSHDARLFYTRYPQWSLMGKMVADTRAVLDAITALEDVDTAQIYFLGYSLGAKVGLLTAALDPRVRGVVAVSGVFPFRLDTPEKGTEGIRHYSHLHGLLPKLGFFLGSENRVPFDYDEVLAAIAPRAVLVVAPAFDRYAPVDDVREEVSAARKVYRLLGEESRLELWTPRDFNRFPVKLQEEIGRYLAKAVH